MAGQAVACGVPALGHPAGDHHAAQDPERAAAFVALPLYDKYQSALRGSGTIDFHDMITDATEHLEQRRVRAPWQLVIVDEFQDIAPGRAAFLKALVG